MKEIELENFKSFGRRLRLPFLPGYTAITGPNGSGKSNLSDAVLFVLGPKSAKVIRAGRLTDLIYDGGQGGKPAAYCRVSLVFDNADRAVPLESDDVRLTRYVGRSTTVEDGYNSYFYVNGRKATLSEFDDLLADAKISAEGYNIVQQGDVGRIVKSTPVERRRVLEDIAGISRFDEDIRQAERKRRDVEENLGRIEIILKEIRRQLRQLARDREGALRYREFQEGLEKARGQKARKEVLLLQQQLASTRGQVDKYETEQTAWQQTLEGFRADLKGEEDRLRELEARVAEEGGEEAKEVQAGLDHLRIERARAQDEIERAREAIKELRASAGHSRRDLKKVKGEKKTRKGEDETAKHELHPLDVEIAAKEKAIGELERGVSESDHKFVQLQKKAVALDLRVDEREAAWKELVLQHEKLTQKREQLEEQLAELEADREAREVDARDADWQAKESASGSQARRKELRQLEDRAKRLEKERAGLVQQSAELESAVRRLSRVYTHLQAESEAAENIRKGYNRAVSSILEARDRGTLKGIHGTIAELGQVEERYEQALHIAAGARMQAIVVEDDAVAAHAIDYLKRKRRGRAIFLPLNKMLSRRPGGKAHLAAKKALGFALDLVTFEEAYRNAFEYVFGDTVVVKDLTQARKLMGGVRLVTLDGQLVEASGAMVGGHLGDVLLRFGKGAENKLADAAAELQRASGELERVHHRLRTLGKELEGLNQKIQEAQGADALDRSQTDLRKAEEKRLKDRLEAIEATLARRGKEKDELSEHLDSLSRDMEEAERKLTEARKRRTDLQAEMREALPQTVSRRLRELQGQRLALVERRNGVVSQRETLRNQITLLEEREGEIEGRLGGAEEALAEEQERSQSQVERLAHLQDEIRGLEKLQENSYSQSRGAREERDSAFREKTRLEGEVAKALAKLETTEDFLLGLRSQVTNLEERVREAQAQATVAENELDALPSMKDIDTEIARCEKGLAAIGAVNLRALEDYEAQEERRAELQGELARMRRERRDLLQLVQELEGKKKAGLLTVFHALKENFVVVYAEISEGGEANIHLEDEEDPFAGGLIIRARPPGKRFHRLEALSGGEKSLVSMAFIFALQRYDPSPFYLLDEVDQNLDAVNAEKVARMIRSIAGEAQFVQISLRKVSLKEADHIVGVTMGRKGLSEVIMQVNLDDVMEEEIPPVEAAAEAAT